MTRMTRISPRTGKPVRKYQKRRKDLVPLTDAALEKRLGNEDSGAALSHVDLPSVGKALRTAKWTANHEIDMLTKAANDPELPWKVRFKAIELLRTRIVDAIEKSGILDGDLIREIATIKATQGTRGGQSHVARYHAERQRVQSVGSALDRLRRLALDTLKNTSPDVLEVESTTVPTTTNGGQGKEPVSKLTGDWESESRTEPPTGHHSDQEEYSDEREGSQAESGSTGGADDAGGADGPQGGGNVEVEPGGVRVAATGESGPGGPEEPDGGSEASPVRPRIAWRRPGRPPDQPEVIPGPIIRHRPSKVPKGGGICDTESDSPRPGPAEPPETSGVGS